MLRDLALDAWLPVLSLANASGCDCAASLARRPYTLHLKSHYTMSVSLNLERILERLSYRQDRLEELLEYARDHLVSGIDELAESMKLGDDEAALAKLQQLRVLSTDLAADSLTESLEDLHHRIEQVDSSDAVTARFEEIRTLVQGYLLAIKESILTLRGGASASVE